MIILDLDNCIADDAWRIPRINWQKTGDARYHDYHMLCAFDAVGNKRLFAHENHVLILTGRPVMVRATTAEWLRRVGVNYLHLVMRNDGDQSPSAALKRKQVLWLRDFYGVELSDVRIAYDDREDICAMYRDLGLRAQCVSIHSVCAYTNPLTAERVP